jgi:hypothetical protein
MENTLMTKRESSATADQNLVYGGKTIRRRGGLLNLTSMWQATARPPGCIPAAWLNRPETKRFIQHLRTTVPATQAAMIADIAGLTFIRHIDPDFLLVRTYGRKRGTWVHWQIALAYAQFLDPAFHAWCNDVVRDNLDHAGGRLTAAVPPMPHDLEHHLGRLHDRFDIVDRHAADILFLVTAAQELLLGNRRPFSERSQAVMCKVVAMPPFARRCPSCNIRSVLSPEGKPLLGSQFDHFFHRGLNRPELGWLICRNCHDNISRGGYMMRFTRLPEFREFQTAVISFMQAQLRSM